MKGMKGEVRQVNQKGQPARNISELHHSSLLKMDEDSVNGFSDYKLDFNCILIT